MYIVPLVTVLMVLRHVHQEKSVYSWELWKSISCVMPFHNTLEEADLHIFPFIKLIIYKIFWFWNSLTQPVFSFLRLCSEYLPLKLILLPKLLCISQCSLEILGKSVLFGWTESCLSYAGIISSTLEMQNPWQERKGSLVIAPLT